MKKKKLTLSDLNVKSYITSLNNPEEFTIKGKGPVHGTLFWIFCIVEPSSYCPASQPNEVNCPTYTCQNNGNCIIKQGEVQ